MFTGSYTLQVTSEMKSITLIGGYVPNAATDWRVDNGTSPSSPSTGLTYIAGGGVSGTAFFESPFTYTRVATYKVDSASSHIWQYNNANAPANLIISYEK